MLPEYFSFHVPTKVVYGTGLVRKLGGEMAMFGRRKALLVTDKVLAGLGLPEKVRAGLEGSGIKIVAQYDDVPPNSEVSTVEACAAVGKAAGVNLIIALGGGSVIDTAKVANIIMKKGGTLADHQGAQLVTKALFPLVVIPTTAGTGSEVTKVAVIADLANHLKMPFTEDFLQPNLAVLDAEMTQSMPPRVTGATGMDALTHAIEAYVGVEASPASDGLALEAIRMISRNILQAAAYPDDLEARGAMLAASCLAGIAFSHSMVGVVHACAHALGGVYHLPHGEANAIMLPYGMEHNLDAKLERFADIAVALGVRPTPSRHVTAHLGILKVRMLARQLVYLEALAPNLERAGIDDGFARLEETVDKAVVDGAVVYNPTEISREQFTRMLRRAYKQPAFPIPVSRKSLQRAAQRERAREIRHAFKDTEELVDILGGFLLSLKDHPEIGPSVLNSDLLIRFDYRNPTASVTIDARGDEIHYVIGECDLKPEIAMSMEADWAHTFWLGQANLVTALTRRQVFAKGAVHKATKLLPILKPAFQLYPNYLRENGHERLVL